MNNDFWVCLSSLYINIVLIKLALLNSHNEKQTFSGLGRSVGFGLHVSHDYANFNKSRFSTSNATVFAVIALSNCIIMMAVTRKATYTTNNKKKIMLIYDLEDDRYSTSI